MEKTKKILKRDILWLSSCYSSKHSLKHAEGKYISDAERALIRIMWRKIYAHFVKVVTANKAFDPNAVATDTFRLFMSRIMAYQNVRRKFFHQRRFSNLPKVLPKKAMKQVLNLGALNTHTGKFVIHTKIKRFLHKYKVWNDFNRQIQANSYKKLNYRKRKKKH